jgi:CheY-like chemotaxis protein
VVDDERDIAAAVECLLVGRGYRVAIAHDGRTGLQAAIALRPDLILLDYEMPELDGLEVIDALRARADTAQTPVLLATAGAIRFEEIRKANGFLVKPFQADALYDVIESLLTRKT